MATMRGCSFLWLLFFAPTSLLMQCDSLITSEVLSRGARRHTSSNKNNHLLPARRRYYMDGEYYDDGLSRKRHSSTDRPTQTRTDRPGPAIVPSKPKIVVLGASGMIGRLVVRQLLDNSNLDATIVAFVRDYDKACRVLYDDILVAKSKKKGPKLQIVLGDLIPPEELPGYKDDNEEEQAWLKRAKSAASFYGNSVKDYDDRENDDGNEPEPDEALKEAIRGCTTIISCVGSVRPTNLWTDFLARPVWRLLRKDVSDWCNDPRHPFYVHFHTTRKALHMAEREQLRREAAAAVVNDDGKEKDIVPRIRFIRVSDLCVAQPPWQFVPLLTNAFHSMVFRYQELAEKILEASSVIDTLLLRPGDLVDDERDVNTTSLQVDPFGSVPFPARVGRDDVAALAVAAALFNSERQPRNKQATTRGSAVDDDDEPFHYTLACRWVGESMGPYPAQGKMSHGLPNAHLCMQSALRKLRRHENRRRRRRQHATSTNAKAACNPDQAMQRMERHWKATAATPRRKIKPYGICVAVPVYLVLAMMAKSVLYYAARYIPGGGGGMTLFQPVLSRMTNALAMVAAFVIGQVSQLPSRILSLPKWIPWRCKANYISF